MNLYDIIAPRGKRAPILVSVPHSGTAIPQELKNNYDNGALASMDDTDWFVDQLYDFCPGMGITMIKANYSRWVIDLNRDPASEPLYDDGRMITDLCPTSTFAGEPIYKPSCMPDRNEIQRRLNDYYWPYYHKIQSLLSDLKTQFGRVLFWDAHSIRQYVPLIREEVFPDLILGDNDEKAAAPDLIEKALAGLSPHIKIEHNHPFKGGHLTRYFGHPSEDQHALQLEMTKINYMDNSERHYDAERAAIVRERLKHTFSGLIDLLQS